MIVTPAAPLLRAAAGPPFPGPKTASFRVPVGFDYYNPIWFFATHKNIFSSFG
jgi:hypothetical protein